MNHKTLLFFGWRHCWIYLFFAGVPAFGQQGSGWGNGPAPFEMSSCLSEPERQEMMRQTRHHSDSLRQLGLLPDVGERSAVSFIWPLQQATGFTDPGYYGISNYIDHDASGGLREYTCATRTYDGHKGTDIFTWPFTWTKMDENAVEIIAAAAGTIVNKYDGNYSYNCSFTGSWNAVYVEHSDGSVAWYGHMKEGTLTSKGIGQTVAQGEYLGVVGSSGWSTGPHLHLEVYDNGNNLIDPWVGSCNPTTGVSWWTSQQNYHVSMINKISTHSQVAVLPQCYGTEAPNFSNQFIPTNTVYCYAFLRDQLVGQQMTFTIKRPNGTTYATWTGTAGTYYPAAYWYYYFTLPSNAPLGTWTYSFTHNGVTLNHSFSVLTAAPVELLSFKGAIDGDGNRLQWSTASETGNRRFVIERSARGDNFEAIAEVPGAGDATSIRHYGFVDVLTKPESWYYRLLQEDFDGKVSYSPVVYLNRQSRPTLEIMPNPVRDFLQVQWALPDNWQDELEARLVSADGSIVLRENFTPESGAHSWNWPVGHLPAGIYSLQVFSASIPAMPAQKVIKID